MKTYYLFAGVNGCGKSTLYDAVNSSNKELENSIRINSDELIRRKYNNNWKDLKVQCIAIRESLLLLHDCFNKGLSINQETTLTGKSIFQIIQSAKNLDYKIIMHYIGVDNYDIAISRVSSRIEKGGHGISSGDIKRRYVNSLKNLSTVLPLCDETYLYDNSKNFVLIAKYKNGVLTYLNSDYKCNWFSNLNIC